MAIRTVVSSGAPDYCDFASSLSWDISELSFRVRAVLQILHADDGGIDTDREPGLALSYLLQGIVNRADELAQRAGDSACDYQFT